MVALVDEGSNDVERMTGLVALERAAPQRRARTPDPVSASQYRSPTRVPLYPYGKDAPCLAFSQRHSITAQPHQHESNPGRSSRNQPEPRPQWCIDRLKARPAWMDRHHVIDSKDNSSNNVRRRQYFDGLPLSHVQVTNAEACTETPPEYQPGTPKEKLDDVASEDVGESDIKLPERSKIGALKKAKSKAADSKTMKLYRATSAVPGLEIVAEFYLWCANTFKNLTRCWQALDVNLDMSVGYLEFLTGLKKYNYDGDGRKLFKFLDRDGSGLLSYYHFDPHGASELASLLSWCEGTFGNVGSAFEALDRSKSGFLTVQDLTEGAKKYGFSSEAIAMHLFDLLDKNDDKKLRRNEFEFLDRWKCPAYLKADADLGAAMLFKKRLVEKHRNNAIVGWHMKLDKDHSMRVSWEEFKIAARENRKVESKVSMGMNTISERKLAAIWRALDKNLSGWLSLREWSAPAYMLLVRFKEFYTEKCGSLQAAVRYLDAGSMNAQISRKEFEQIQTDLDLTDADTDYLFDGLDMDGSGQIAWGDLKYLDKWDHLSDQREEQFWHIINQELMDLQQGKARRTVREADKADAQPKEGILKSIPEPSNKRQCGNSVHAGFKPPRPSEKARRGTAFVDKYHRRHEEEDAEETSTADYNPFKPRRGTTIGKKALTGDEQNDVKRRLTRYA
eukprot:gnl/MRDRNA2_/MRDRNA2_104909_c0_seq1.p1 gnl/MRDRNA2_/MRDRNA2_104909_c0~~gnl/MRDRNA2_/MRDRNA2_104909_c0_seq1.p1  ORF type:complete len:675 (-),score=132.28 gnl/MRDRNA2_/MRDRNA2_104909_c0_seq1:40-2064(-)